MFDANITVNNVLSVLLNKTFSSFLPSNESISVVLYYMFDANITVNNVLSVLLNKTFSSFLPSNESIFV